MNRIMVGIVLIFAAAWLMFKLQSGNGSSSPEECGGSETDPESRLGRALELRQEHDRQQNKRTSDEEGSDKGRIETDEN